MSEPDLQTFRHDQASRTGVLMVNLGTPDAPDRASVRRYLKEFLWDPRVVEMARPIWWLVLNGVILNTRPGRSAKAYQKVWTEQGSPLLVISQKQREALAGLLEQRSGDEVPVALGMRYGNPSIRSALEELRDAGARRILVLPMYPQYSATTTASIFDAVTDGTARLALAARAALHQPLPRRIRPTSPHWRTASGTTAQNSAIAEKLLMSFHGIPEEYFHKGDPYYCECQKTGRLLAESLGSGCRRNGNSASSRASVPSNGCSLTPTIPSRHWPGTASSRSR